MTNAEKEYADIINMPHHTSPNRPRMSYIDRGAQFSPFAALTGYEAAVEETGRLTDTKHQLSEDVKSFLNEKMQIIVNNLYSEPIVSITHFVPDKKKSGGAYVTTTGVVKEISECERTIIFTDRSSIPIDQIREIDGELFRNMDFY